MYVKTENIYGSLNTIQMILADAVARACASAATLEEAMRVAGDRLRPYPLWAVYKGGSHVAVIHNRDRVLLVTEARF